MITNETEIRIALQAVLVSVLALTGYWGCAVLVLLLLIPWKPIFAVGGYLAEPVVEWRVQKARGRKERGIEEIEKDLKSILNPPKPPYAPSKSLIAVNKTSPQAKFPLPASPARFQPFKAPTPTAAGFRRIPESAEDLAAIMDIPPAIKNHVQSLPQGVFSNMDLEVEEVKFRGEMAEAYVRFKSSSVSGLVIRQCYLLRKSGDHWEVESRKPTNGGGKPLPPFQAATRPELRPT